MKNLLVSDLHLLEEDVEGTYKSNIFITICNLIIEHSIQRVVFMGDLTEKKDIFSSRLVNFIVDGIAGLTHTSAEIFILKGNHDYVDADMPFFGFLRHIPKIRYIDKPWLVPIDNTLFLPHTRTPVEDWKSLKLKKADHIFMHQPIIGSVASNGFALQEGLPADYFKGFKEYVVFAGDIHTPQTINNVTYVGSPYPVYFGDDFVGQCLIVDGKYLQAILLPNIQKMSVQVSSDVESSLACYDIRQNDQIKVKVYLYPSEFYQYPELKERIKIYCESKGAILVSTELKKLQDVKPSLEVLAAESITKDIKDYFNAYGQKNKIDTGMIANGHEIIRDYNENLKVVGTNETK